MMDTTKVVGNILGSLKAIQKDKGHNNIPEKPRELSIGKCPYCGQKGKLYRFNNKTLCEDCLENEILNVRDELGYAR